MTMHQGSTIGRVARLGGVITGGFLLAAVFIGLVFAATITIDGDPSDWPGTEDCTIGAAGCPRVAGDPDETGVGDIPNQWDIENVYMTNNATTLFWRFDTYSDTNHNISTEIFICMDTDALTTTGGSISQCDGAPSTSMDGVDYVLDIYRGNPLVDLLSCPDTGTTIADCSVVTTATVSVASSSSTTEVSVLLSDLDINSTTCDPQPCDITASVYFDNGDTPPDDNVPDSGQFTPTVGGGSPTAITLRSVSARPRYANTVVLLAGTLAALGTLGLVSWTSRRRTWR